MIFTFKKGKHRARPLYWLHWWPFRVNPKEISYEVRFSVSSKYWLQGDDQFNQNKLPGFGFLSPTKRSARFSYNYDKGSGKFSIHAFRHYDGPFQFDRLFDMPMNVWYRFRLQNLKHKYLFEISQLTGPVVASKEFTKGHSRKWALLLGPYFGGKPAAPNTCDLEIRNLKIK